MSDSRSPLPVAKEGLPFILGFLCVSLLFTLIRHPFFIFLSALSAALAVFCCYFFRDPKRAVPADPSFIVSPADGKVMEVTEEQTPYAPGKLRVIKIFLSVFDVHVQRSPIAGQIVKTQHKTGKFYDARDPRACFENEYNDIVIENPQCKVVVKQIAGLIARRIVCSARPGQAVALGDRLGLIRFGSQVDLFLPLEAEVWVKKGDRVENVATVIATLKKTASRVS